MSSDEPTIGDEPKLKRLLRRTAHAVMRSILRTRATACPTDTAGITLVIAPHQDDDVFGCGGLIALRRLAGREVHVVYLTDGSASHPGHPTLTMEMLATQRAAEARAALRMLGVESTAIHFLGARDGTLNRLAAKDAATLSESLEKLLRELRPEEIFLPAGDDGSSEHEAAFRIFTHAHAASGIHARVREFAIWSWWSPRLLWRKLRRGQRVSRCEFRGYEFLKARALAAHRSQTEPAPPWDRPVLAPEFYRMFLAPEEFFFET